MSRVPPKPSFRHTTSRQIDRRASADFELQLLFFSGDTDLSEAEFIANHPDSPVRANLDRLRAAASPFSCPVHREQPTIHVTDADSSYLYYEFHGCCDASELEMMRTVYRGLKTTEGGES